MDLTGFNADNFSEEKGFGAIPEGTYTARILSSEDKPTKNGLGSYLELQLEIIEGEYKGWRVWDRLNLRNPSQEAVEIAMKTLATICKAIGVRTPRDSTDLHNKPMSIKVAVREYNGQHSNEIKKYMPAEQRPQNEGMTYAKLPWE